MLHGRPNRVRGACLLGASLLVVACETRNDTFDGTAPPDATASPDGGPPLDATASPDAEDGGAGLMRVWFRGGAPLPHEDCLSTGACSGKKTCFRLAHEFAMCDGPQRAATDQCAPLNPSAPPPPHRGDECGCDGGVCETGQVCIAAEEQCSCAPHQHNGCVDTPCTTPADCPEGLVCTPASLILPWWSGRAELAPRRCVRPACRSDADCIDGNEGRCSLLIDRLPQAGEMFLAGIRCAYSALSADGGACRGTIPFDLGGGYYMCRQLPN
jgi:hypothetical protein